jgi:hypothetical protein
MLLHEPKYVKRLATSAALYVRGKFAAGRYRIGRLPLRYRTAVQ